MEEEKKDKTFSEKERTEDHKSSASPSYCAADPRNLDEHYFEEFDEVEDVDETGVLDDDAEELDFSVEPVFFDDLPRLDVSEKDLVQVP